MNVIQGAMKLIVILGVVMFVLIFFGVSGIGDLGNMIQHGAGNVLGFFHDHAPAK